MLLHREAFLQSELYTEKLSRASFYTQKLLHRANLYTQKLLHTEDFTLRSFYARKLLRREAFIYTE